MFLRGDDFLHEHFVGALLLRCGHAEFGLRRDQVCLRLVVLVLHIAGVDLDDEVSRTHQRARLHRHACDLAAGLGLHFHDVDRLDDAVGLRVNDDVAARDRRGGDAADLGRSAAAGRGKSGRSECDDEG